MTDDVDWQPGIVFTHTLSLTLDDKAQEILQGIRDQLMAVGVPVLHQPAHITVAAVSTMEESTLILLMSGGPRESRSRNHVAFLIPTASSGCALTTPPLLTP